MAEEVMSEDEPCPSSIVSLSLDSVQNERFRQRSEARDEAVQKRQQKTDERAGKRQKKEGSLLAGKYSQEESERAISNLIEAVRRAANCSMGEGNDLSQLFHRTVGRRIESFFGQKPEGFKVSDLGPVVYDVLQLLSDE